MKVSAADVKKLRDLTDAPIMECKQALEEAEGDVEKAVEVLRKKGQAAAAKRADRSTSEGIARTSVTADGRKVAGVVVECETDFVSNNADFKAMVQEVADGLAAALDPAPGTVVEAGPDTVVGGKALSVYMEEAVAKIRENIQLRKAVVAAAPAEGAIGTYNHHTGKSAALVVVSGTASGLTETGGQIAMQVVAYPPSFLKRDDVPAAEIEKQLQIETERAVNEGKAPDVAAKVAQGRVQKEFYQANVLTEQIFFVDGKKKVSEYLAEQAKAGGGTAALEAYVLLKVGG